MKYATLSLLETLKAYPYLAASAGILAALVIGGVKLLEVLRSVGL